MYTVIRSVNLNSVLTDAQKTDRKLCADVHFTRKLYQAFRMFLCTMT